jgi:Domain of unknown function (DUF4157)
MRARATARTRVARTGASSSLARKTIRHPIHSALLTLQRTVGNQAVRTLLRSDVSDHGPSVESRIDRLRVGGDTLPNSVRSFFEPRFGRDLGDVRIHTGSAASESAKAVDARAYTMGRDVVFGEGQYTPDTRSGKRLIAHELTHVVQQSGASQAPAHATLQRQGTHVDQCMLTPADKLSPRDWVRCVYKGSIDPAEADPLRFTFTGEVATPKALAAWKDRKQLTLDVAIRHVLYSHEFSGTAKAQQDAKTALLALPTDRRSVCIRPVQIADDDGKNSTKLPSFDAAKTIWGKCCIDVSVKGGKTISKTAFKTLDHEGAGGYATAEEASMIKAAGASDCISVFVPETFKQGGTTSKDIDGGGVHFGTPGLGEAVVVVEGVDPTIVAHELGHAMGYQPHRPAGTVMEVTASKHDQKESDQVAWGICDKIRESASSTGGKEDCYADAP